MLLSACPRRAPCCPGRLLPIHPGKREGRKITENRVKNRPNSQTLGSYWQRTVPKASQRVYASCVRRLATKMCETRWMIHKHSLGYCVSTEQNHDVTINRTVHVWKPSGSVGRRSVCHFGRRTVRRTMGRIGKIPRSPELFHSGRDMTKVTRAARVRDTHQGTPVHTGRQLTQVDVTNILGPG